MQFSIFGVPFKCTKDMFAWEKIKWSILFYWALLWRGGALGAVAVFFIFSILLAPAFLNPESIMPFFGNSNLDGQANMYFIYALVYWYQHLWALGIVLFCLWSLGLILGMLYIQYYSMFKKNYQSFSRQFNKPEVKSIWSGGFWKPFIFTMILGLLFGWIAGFVLELMNVQQVVIALIGFIVGLVLFHIFIHGGTWGFVPVSKQAKDKESEIKS